MTFDLIRFARDLMARSGYAEVLELACRTVAEVSGQPAFAAHVLPSRGWDSATVVCAGASRSAAVHSALYAIYRRLARSTGSIHVAHALDLDAMFRALSPAGAPALDALPLRTHGGQLTGVLVTGRAAHHDAAMAQAFEHIAALTGPAVDAAWRHTQTRRDQERLHLFSETSDESLWDWDIARNEMWWGGSVEQRFGMALASKHADWRRAHLHEDDADRIIASFEAARGGSESSWSETYRLRGADGAIIDVREHAYFLREVDGRAYRAIGTVRDVSALQQLLVREQRARAEAERASAVKDEFLAMLGHELRNPLAPIIAVLELLEHRAAGPDRHLEIMRRQSQHLVRLVDDLLDVSRISRGKVELVRQRTPLAPLIARAVEMASPLLDQRRHHLALDVAPDLVLEADGGRVAQVVSNLLANAAKFTEPGGHVGLTARGEHGCAVIRVRDDGIGIAPAFLPHIFEMFTQGSQAIDRAQGGLGLGLSIVKNIVQLHGGAVAVHSEGVGRGTEFVVRLPLATPDAAVVAFPSASAPRTTQGARDLLIVDDNEDAAALLGELLASDGHAVRVAYHPDDALRLFAEARPDIALLDIGLPGMDGYELVRRMRGQPGGAATRYVAITGYGQAADREKTRAAGFDAHLVKPVVPESLERVIAELAKVRA